MKILLNCVNQHFKVYLLEWFLQEDLSTPVHSACLQGNLEILQLMYEHQRENFLNALHTPDSQQMTPLHKAIQLNQPFVVDFLCDKVFNSIIYFYLCQLILNDIEKKSSLPDVIIYLEKKRINKSMNCF